MEMVGGVRHNGFGEKGVHEMPAVVENQLPVLKPIA